MKEWFAYRNAVDGSVCVARVSEIVGVAQHKSGIIMKFRDADRPDPTDTYDVAGFISNVLEDEDLLTFVTDPDDGLAADRKRERLRKDER